MTLAGWIIGLIGLGSFFGLCVWLVQQGKKIKEGEHDKERVILLESHQKSLKRWFSEVDRLADESNRLKKLVGNADFDSVSRVFNEAHGNQVSTSEKSKTSS